MGQTISLAVDTRGVATLTLDRPDKHNAMSGEMNAGLERTLDFAERSADVRVIVLTGAGGAFCAGGDVKGMNEANQAGGRRAGQPDGLEDRVAYLRHRQRQVSLALHEHPKPIVAALPGAAASGSGSGAAPVVSLPD